MPTLTEAFVKVAAAKPGAERTIWWDETQPSFGLLVTGKGARSYVVQYRHDGVSRRLTLKPGLTLKDARKEARHVLGAVAKGGDPLAERRKAAAEATNTLQAVCKDYLDREGKRLRGVEARRAVLERTVYPRLGDRQIESIRRSEIVKLLEMVEAESGPDAG